MKVVYVGQYQEGVEVPMPSGAMKFCPWGDEVDVPDALGKSLLEQDENWQKTKPKKADSTSAAKDKE